MKNGLLVLAMLLGGCTGALTKLSQYEAPDVDAAIAIADKAGDTARLRCFYAIKNQIELQALVRGILSQNEVVRVGLLNLTMSCSTL
jgi:hypothetical protein